SVRSSLAPRTFACLRGTPVFYSRRDSIASIGSVGLEFVLRESNHNRRRGGPRSRSRRRRAAWQLPNSGRVRNLVRGTLGTSAAPNGVGRGDPTLRRRLGVGARSGRGIRIRYGADRPRARAPHAFLAQGRRRA